MRNKVKEHEVIQVIHDSHLYTSQQRSYADGSIKFTLYDVVFVLNPTEEGMYKINVEVTNENGKFLVEWYESHLLQLEAALTDIARDYAV